MCGNIKYFQWGTANTEALFVYNIFLTYQRIKVVRLKLLILKSTSTFHMQFFLHINISYKSNLQRDISYLIESDTLITSSITIRMQFI